MINSELDYLTTNSEFTSNWVIYISDLKPKYTKISR